MSESPLISFEGRDLSGTLDAAIEIAKRRAVSLRQLREALVRGDDVEALSIARKVCGLNETLLRVAPREHRRTGRQR